MVLKGDICMVVVRGAKKRQTITIYFIISLLLIMSIVNEVT